MGSSNHEFNQEQADAILKRAIDLQVEQSAVKGSVDLPNTISLQQLYRSAAEIGIEASHVRQAAEELAVRPLHRAKTDPREPALLEQEFQVEVRESDFPDLLEYLRTETKTPGTAHVIGGTLEWQAYSTSRRELMHVAVIPTDRMTRVKIRTSNPFGAMSRVGIAFPLIILSMGLIPIASFGFRFFQWTELIPFVIIAAFVALVPYKFGLKRFPWSKKTKGNESLMDSVSVWMEHLRASRDDPSGL